MMWQYYALLPIHTFATNTALRRKAAEESEDKRQSTGINCKMSCPPAWPAAFGFLAVALPAHCSPLKWSNVETENIQKTNLGTNCCRGSKSRSSIIFHSTFIFFQAPIKLWCGNPPLSTEPTSSRSRRRDRIRRFAASHHGSA